MWYEINVSLNGRHYFATAERSIKSEADARAIYASFQKRFPASEGFGIECTRWQKSGMKCDFDPVDVVRVRLGSGENNPFGYGRYTDAQRNWLMTNQGKEWSGERAGMLNHVRIITPAGSIDLHLYDLQFLNPQQG